VLLAREFGWTPQQMRELTIHELTAILNELQKQIVIEQYNEQRNKWAFLAAVITNGFNIFTTVIAGVFGGKKRKPKLVEPDDFMNKDAKKILQRLLGHELEQKDWSKHIDDVRIKGLAGPW